MSPNLISFDFLPNCCLDKLLCPLYLRTLPAGRRKQHCSAQCAQQFAPTLWPVSRFRAACVHTMQKVEIYTNRMFVSLKTIVFCVLQTTNVVRRVAYKNNHKTKNPARWCCQWHQFFLDFGCVPILKGEEFWQLSIFVWNVIPVVCEWSNSRNFKNSRV